MNKLMQDRATIDSNGHVVGYADLEDNPITDTDSYKPSHSYQDQDDIESKYYYFESRGGRYKDTQFVGLQPILLRHFAKRVTMNHVQEADEIFAEHGEPFNRAGWERIVTHHDGRMPLRIRAVPEGTVVPVSNVLYDVELTQPDPQLRWLPGWLEAKLSRTWYPSTVAARGHYIKRIILDALVKSSDDPMSEIDFKLHCFGS